MKRINEIYLNMQSKEFQTVYNGLYDWIENYQGIEYPTERDFVFVKDDYRIDIPESQGENAYIYTAYEEVTDAYKNTVNEKMYSKLNEIIQNTVIEYRKKVLEKYCAPEKDKTSYYNRHNTEIKNQLKRFYTLLTNTANKNISLQDNLSGIETGKRPIAEKLMSGNIFVDEAIKKVMNEFNSYQFYSVIDNIIDSHISLNSKEELQEDGTYKTIWCYSNLRGAFEDIAEHILSSFESSDIASAAFDTAKDCIDEYNRLIKAALEKKMESINVAGEIKIESSTAAKPDNSPAPAPEPSPSELLPLDTFLLELYKFAWSTDIFNDINNKSFEESMEANLVAGIIKAHELDSDGKLDDIFAEIKGCGDVPYKDFHNIAITTTLSQYNMNVYIILRMADYSSHVTSFIERAVNNFMKIIGYHTNKFGENRYEPTVTLMNAIKDSAEPEESDVIELEYKVLPEKRPAGNDKKTEKTGESPIIPIGTITDKPVSKPDVTMEDFFANEACFSPPSDFYNDMSYVFNTLKDADLNYNNIRYAFSQCKTALIKMTTKEREWLQMRLYHDILVLIYAYQNDLIDMRYIETVIVDTVDASESINLWDTFIQVVKDLNSPIYDYYNC